MRIFRIAVIVAASLMFLSLMRVFSQPEANGLDSVTSNTAMRYEAGWQPIPGTVLTEHCPANDLYDYPFADYCHNVVFAWGGADLDESSGQLYLWGGGHNDYYGNEVYQLDAISGALRRLTKPAQPADPDTHPKLTELLPFDGSQPNSRHTYDGMAFISNKALLWAFSGALAGRHPGAPDPNTWLFDPDAKRWHKDAVSGDIPRGAFGVVAAYDSKTGLVYLHDRAALYSYQFRPEGGLYTKLNDRGGLGLGVNAAIDPVNRKMLIIGQKKQILYDLTAESGYQRTSLPLQGDAEFINQFPAPGLSYNSKDGHFYAWPGDGKLYQFDLASLSWRGIAIEGDPGSQVRHGTFGRFAYVQQLDGFVLLNNPRQPAYFLKLTAQ
ncbi:MAG: hypothetical protein CML20_17360 [Rheinheimera sp.]|uniref:hypothetical protein n=1 Tax=Arsukibacterium sp. UBA3155 TaxID=1946058 RepID=UPI000C98EFE7|nr:hypothetical protein [Arsukibacterium sp. UBA3155]MAD76528.1 hypothetical protein [Rheinheimera sp.]|tara:strand:+ start:180870 stop:182012 length:1143 start_codon:yes stop_codon:yes gene_type:complete